LGSFDFTGLTAESAQEEELHMNRREDTESRIQQQIEELCHHMPRYLSKYNSRPPFNEEQLYLHRQTIQLQHHRGSVQAALRDDDFINKLWHTLDKWRMNSRLARLQPLPGFASRLRNYEDQLIALERFDIEDHSLPLNQIAQQLSSLIEEMKLSQTGSQVVTGSKALHHIIPDLVPPIDRGYTRRFFWFWMPQFQYHTDIFPYIWMRFAQIARRTNPSQYVNKGDWATSKTKVLDNAIIGYCNYHDLPPLR
jgi:hypothetical protein